MGRLTAMDPIEIAGELYDRAREVTHQSARAAAIDKADIVLGKSLSQSMGSFDKAWAGTGAGAAIDANGFDLFGFDLIHRDHVALHPVKLKSRPLR